MRIISQNGMCDLPYEETTLHIFDDGRVIAFALDSLETDTFITMAKYSTKEKAIEVMDMLRDNYCVSAKVFQFPKDEEVQI